MNKPKMQKTRKLRGKPWAYVPTALSYDLDKSRSTSGKSNRYTPHVGAKQKRKASKLKQQE